VFSFTFMTNFLTFQTLQVTTLPRVHLWLQNCKHVSVDFRMLIAAFLSCGRTNDSAIWPSSVKRRISSHRNRKSRNEFSLIKPSSSLTQSWSLIWSRFRDRNRSVHIASRLITMFSKRFIVPTCSRTMPFLFSWCGSKFFSSKIKFWTVYQVQFLGIWDGSDETEYTFWVRFQKLHLFNFFYFSVFSCPTVFS
jgi:hypothetical protein